MPVQVLDAAEPLTVPAKVYDKVWIKEVIIHAPDPNGDATARVCLQRFTVNDGVAELEPESPRWLEVPGILAGAEADEELGAAVTALMAYVEKVGREQGVIA